MRATHKFRSEFGKSRLVRDKEKLLVAFSGGRASSAMVHLIEQVLLTNAFVLLPGLLLYQGQVT